MTTNRTAADKDGYDSAGRTAVRESMIFSVVVLSLALAAGMVLRLFTLPAGAALLIWGSTPVIAVLVMVFGARRQGRTGDSLRSLGLRRLGGRTWGIAFGVTLATSLLAAAAVVALGFASFRAPGGWAATVVNFVISVAVVTATFAVAEEVGFRGYLLPRLLHLGRNRALAVSGLVHAAWHLPLILLTPLYHAGGNRLLVLPLFTGTIVAAGFYLGDLRLATGSVWPAALAHAVHNVAWGFVAGFTVTGAPVLVEEYLAGDNGGFVLLFTVAAAVLLRHWLAGRGARPSAAPPADDGADRAAAVVSRTRHR